MSDYSKSQEYRVERVFTKAGFKAKRVPFSGAIASIGKGDVKVDDGRILVDHKSTRGKASIGIKKSDLVKIKQDAGEGNLGLITFSYFNDSTLYVALPLAELLPYLQCQPVILDE